MTSFLLNDGRLTKVTTAALMTKCSGEQRNNRHYTNKTEQGTKETSGLKCVKQTRELIRKHLNRMTNGD